MELSRLGHQILEFALPIGIAVFVLGALATGLTGDAANVLNSITTGLATTIATYWPIYLTMIFIFGIYALYMASAVKKGKSRR